MNNLTPQQRAALHLTLFPLPTYSSESDDDFAALAVAAASTRVTQVPNGWWENEVPEMTDAEFKSHFRLARASFTALSASITQQWIKPRRRGRAPMPAAKALAMTLWRLANTTTFREVGRQFGILRATAFKIVARMLKMLIAQHGHIIRLPSNATEWNSARTHFAPYTSFHNTVGAIDGSHIRLIYPPKRNRRHFQNRKKFPSIVMQAIVNHRALYMDVAVGAEGSMHDAFVWVRSDASDTIPSTIPPHHYLVGDSAYPASPFLLTPFKSQLTAQEMRYNKSLSSTRVVVELTFGQTKCRWRCLNGVRTKDIDNADLYALVSCILHNWLSLNNDGVLLEWMETQSKLQEALNLQLQQAGIIPAVDEDRPTLMELYQHHLQQQPQQGPAPQPPAPVHAPHLHVQLDAARQTLFNQYFTNGAQSVSASNITDIGLHLRDQIAATY